MKNFEYKKSLGQNFLIDENIRNKIIESANIGKDSLIIEIGPGSGSLTKKLITLDAKIVCFEIDERLKPELDLIKSDKLEIIFNDFLKLDLKAFLSTKEYKHLYFIANLPYYITTAIINKIHSESDADGLIFMVQKEVAERFMAKPGTKSYNSLSVFLQYNYDIEKVTLVSKNCFFPKPKVDSMVIKFSKKENKLFVKDLIKFYKLIKDSFQYKRKNLKNNLKDYPLEIIQKVLKESNKDLTSRAENLSVEDFVNISNSLF